MEYFLTNRDLIKNLAINTGTSQNPSYSNLCVTSELTLNEDFEQKDFYVYCDAIRRSIITGVAMTLEGVAKLDINNTAIQEMISKVHTLIASGEIAQFNNIEVKFDLLDGVNGAVLSYTTYYCNVMLSLEGLGGSAEDEGEVSFTMTINGTGSVSA